MRKIDSKRRIVMGSLATLALAPGAALAGATGIKNKDTRPNILFILADDLGWGDLGAYGQLALPIPDEVAVRGVNGKVQADKYSPNGNN